MTNLAQNSNLIASFEERFVSEAFEMAVMIVVVVVVVVVVIVSTEAFRVCNGVPLAFSTKFAIKIKE